MTLCQLLECASITERKQKFVQFLLILGKQVSHTFFMNVWEYGMGGLSYVIIKHRSQVIIT